MFSVQVFLSHMHILITGGGGFLGQRLARQLLAGTEPKVTRLTLVDVVEPANPTNDARVTAIKADLAEPNAATSLLASGVDAIFQPRRRR